MNEKEKKKSMNDVKRIMKKLSPEQIEAFKKAFALLEHPFKVVDTFSNEFAEESDRAAVILSTSMIEDLLESILRSRLVPGIDEEMFKGYGPLSSLNSRIEMAYGIGAISIKLKRDLTLIRRIRNEFAHNVEGCSFENQSIRHRIVEIERSMPVVERWTNIENDKIGTPRDKFETAISFILMHLSMLQQVSIHIPVCPEEGLYNRNSFALKPEQVPKPK